MTDIQKILESARATIKIVDYCFFITLDETGHPNARLMQHFKADDTLTIWFGTSPKSRKVQEIQRDNRVTVALFDPGENAYVALKGTAELVDDLEKRKSMWYESWIAFFPAGPAGDDYVLLKFVPMQLEVLNFAHSITPPPFGLQHVNLVKTGEEWVPR
ncbi:MAG: pyridoxamine 5'-phosphate oxidase family protein [Anaerolineae bacterium]|nr:pyridoxamine 5'-phosphate oxidase family protein [Anaerolineae bacterium]